MQKIIIAVVVCLVTFIGAQARVDCIASGVSLSEEKSGIDGVLWRVVQVESPSEARQRSAAEGMLDGQMAAERLGTGGNMLGGLVTGGLTGLIGTGVGYFLLGPSDLKPHARVMMEGEGKGSEYKQGFIIGWEKKTRSRKRGAFLGGGCLGTLLAIVLLYG